jgi:hypothetical protein
VYGSVSEDEDEDDDDDVIRDSIDSSSCAEGGAGSRRTRNQKAKSRS